MAAADIATRQDVARLFGRVAFGATPLDFETWVGQPYVEMVEHVLTVPASPETTIDDIVKLVLTQSGRDSTLLLQAAQQWWLERMRSTAYPIVERMTLLWHNHFATAVRDENNPDLSMVLEQNDTLRRHALGDFRQLVLDLTIDPAMLFWLNGAQNATPEPNENYARELLELFTLGKHPQVYTETDVREAARALTGWVCDQTTHQVAFDVTRHDADVKHILGRTIPNLGADEYIAVVDAALAQPAAAQFVAWKLVGGLAYVPTQNDVTVDPLVRDVAVSLRTRWNIRDALHTLLNHSLFRNADPALGRQLVRQPVDAVVAACKALNVSALNANAMVACQQMGQNLFRPPNVGGWPMGSRWLSPATALARYGWGYIAWTVWANTPLHSELPDPHDLTAWATTFGLAGLQPSTASAINGYLTERAAASPDELRAGVVALLIASPDWMVI